MTASLDELRESHAKSLASAAYLCLANRLPTPSELDQAAEWQRGLTADLQEVIPKIRARQQQTALVRGTTGLSRPASAATLPTNLSPTAELVFHQMRRAMSQLRH